MRPVLVLALMLPLTVHGEDVGVITPACTHPAVLEGHFDGRPNVTVLLNSGKDSRAVALELSKRYGFRIIGILRPIKGFTASLLAPDEIAKLRCEPDVDAVLYEESYDQKTTIGGTVSNAGS